MEHLFVYGTLLRELHHPLHSVLARYAVYRGFARLGGVLYDLDLYPGATRSRDPKRVVRGELYLLTAAAEVIKALDPYEGHNVVDPTSSLFRRYLVDVHAEDGTRVKAWAYLYNRSTAGRPVISSGDYIRFLGRKSRLSNVTEQKRTRG